MRLLSLVWVLVISVVRSAGAQDFVPAAPVMSNGPLALLEHGLAGHTPALTVETGVVRWLGIEDLATRAIAVGGRWRRFSGAAGASATGDDEGWRALGVASGYSSANSGVALRAVARREAAPEAITTALGQGAGLEAGMGAWVRTNKVSIWMSHPQIVVRGAAPPLRRGLETGVRYEADGLSVWGARRSAAGREARHRVGLGLDLGGVANVWAEARDDPLRAGYGIEARLELVAVAFAVETHPVLGETARLSIALSTGDTP